MQLPEIVFSHAKEIPGGGIFICTRPPFNVGKVIKHDDNRKMDEFINRWDLHNKCGLIPGYNILIYWIGTLNKIYDTVPPGKTVTDATLAELNKMAAYYETEYVKKSPKAFNRHVRK